MLRLATLSRSFVAVALALVAVSPAQASPRDEALRVAPPDAALVLVVQDARAHIRDLAESPFAAWFPTSALGKQLFATADLKQFQDFAAPVFAELGVTPDDILNDILGDAIVFAFTPAPADKPKDERAVLLIRPRKPETLTKLLDRLNAMQKKSGEVKDIVRREHNGQTYYERQKPGDGSEFYCFRGGVFAYSTTEPDIKAVLDRDRTAAPLAEKAPELTAKLTKLGVADALAVVLVNPRPLDAEVKAKAAAAKPDDRAFLQRFGEVWAALETAAVYLLVDKGLEVGVSLRFRPDALPAGTQTWLTGSRTPTAIWAAIPPDALFAVAGRFRAADLIEAVGSLVPDKGKNPLKAVLEQFVGPVVGKDKLPVVLNALGPDWAIWAAAPAGGAGPLPVVVAAVQVSGENPEAARVLIDAVDYGFRTARVAYNAGHTDQIELRETKAGDVVIRSLVNDKAFPPGFRPSFAMKGGYLLLASSPDAIAAFQPPTGKSEPGAEVPLARFSASVTRVYLQAHRIQVAKLLADAGQADEKDLLKQLDQIIAVLEPLDRVEVVTRGDADGMRLAVRVQFVKPLKK